MQIKKIISTFFVILLTFITTVKAQIIPTLVNELQVNEDIRENNSEKMVGFSTYLKSEKSDLYYVILTFKFDKKESNCITFAEKNKYYADKIGNKFYKFNSRLHLIDFSGKMACQLSYLTKEDYNKQIAMANDFENEKAVMNYYNSKAKKINFKLDLDKIRKIILDNNFKAIIDVNIVLVSPTKVRVSYEVNKKKKLEDKEK